jgi:hypothetical protein
MSYYYFSGLIEGTATMEVLSSENLKRKGESCSVESCYVIRIKFALGQKLNL